MSLMQSGKFPVTEFPVKINPSFSAILEQSIKNYDLIQAVVREQAKIISKLDPLVDADEYYESSMKEVSDSLDQLKAIVVSNVS